MINLDNINIGEFIRKRFHNNLGESVFVLESSQEGNIIRAEYNHYKLGFLIKTYIRTITLTPEETDKCRAKDY